MRVVGVAAECRVCGGRRVRGHGRAGGRARQGRTTHWSRPPPVAALSHVCVGAWGRRLTASVREAPGQAGTVVKGASP